MISTQLDLGGVSVPLKKQIVIYNNLLINLIFPTNIMLYLLISMIMIILLSYYSSLFCCLKLCQRYLYKIIVLRHPRKRHAQNMRHNKLLFIRKQKIHSGESWYQLFLKCQTSYVLRDKSTYSIDLRREKFHITCRKIKLINEIKTHK